MSKHLERDLEHLHRHVLHLATAVEEAICRSIRALRTRDVALAQRVIVADAGIDTLEDRVNDDCLRVLALHQPVASDLRRIAAVLQINTDLERMGDLAANIAGRAVALAQGLSVAVPEQLQRMTELTVRMVRQSLDSFVQFDRELAWGVIRLDNEVNQLHTELIAHLVRVMQSGPQWVEPGLSLFSASRHLERIADHATNIAEDVVYLVEGVAIRHRPEAARHATPAHAEGPA
jgi:phosphate transport system protein